MLHCLETQKTAIFYIGCITRDNMMGATLVLKIVQYILRFKSNFGYFFLLSRIFFCYVRALGLPQRLKTQKTAIFHIDCITRDNMMGATLVLKIVQYILTFSISFGRHFELSRYFFFLPESFGGAIACRNTKNGNFLHWLYH